MSLRAPRVLLLPSSYMARDRIVGGGERYALELARSLSQRTPTTLGLFHQEPSTTADGPLTIRHFGVRNYDNSRVLFPATAETWRALADYDVVHLLCFPTHLSDLLVPLARARGQVVVLTDVGGGGPTLSGYLQKIHRRLNFHRLAHGLAHLSNYAGHFFSDWRQPSVVLYGGVNPALLGTTSGAPEGYALLVGRLLPHKGILEAIEAVSPQTPLRIVGRPYDPGYFDRLKQAARGKAVTLITEADDTELAQHYAGASVVLQVSLPALDGTPDKSELLGLVALEGMAGGKPVIVTRTTSLPELVRDGETGFVVPPRDSGALREKIEFLLNHPAEAARLGNQAREHVRHTFTWNATAERALSFYGQLARPMGRSFSDSPESEERAS